MKNLFLGIIFSVIGACSLLIPATTVHAQFSPFYEQLDGAANAIDSDRTMRNLDSMIASVIQAVLSMLGIILLVLIVYSALLWMTAAGNATQVAKAKSILTNAIIGMVLVLTSYAITRFVVDAVNDPGSIEDRQTNLTTTQQTSGLSDSPLVVVIGSIIASFFGILGIIFLLLTMYAGFLWMTAAGNADKTVKARRLLTQAVIGLIIMLASYGITRFVINQLDTANLVEDGNDVEINLFGN